jgi:hypothetical protein
MNMPGFTAEVAIYNWPASFHKPALGADRSPGGTVTIAFTCPDDCPCVCGEGSYGRGQIIRNQAS